MQFDPMIQHSAMHMAYRSVLENEERARRPSERAADTRPRANDPQYPERRRGRIRAGGWLPWPFGAGSA